MNKMTDEMLDEVTGGYLHVSQWVSFLTGQILPVINGLMVNASGNDRAILNTIYGTLQSTVVPGASVADPVMNLWAAYNTTYRPSLQSNKVQVTLDQVLYNAKQYIANNR